MEDFKAHEKAVVLVSTKEVVQPSLKACCWTFCSLNWFIWQRP
jgi:hypothetical protein